MPRLCNRCARCKKPMPRVCTKCGQQKPEDEFQVTTSRGKRIVRSWCRGCCNEYYRARRYSKIRQEQMKVFREKAS